MSTVTTRRMVAASTLLGQPQRPKPETVRRFSVWGPANLSNRYGSILDILLAVRQLVVGSGWTEIEFLMKAGEGGSWQGAFDPHPLAPNGPDELLHYVEAARDFGMRVTPYVVVRGRPEWIAGEWAHIKQCVDIAGRCVLNVEPGAPYWNGRNDSPTIYGYLHGIHVPPEALEVCLIPRQTQVNELGGAACIQAWTDPAYVGSASWETYGVAAGISGPTSLLVNEAIPRLDAWGVPADPHYRIPVVQRSERAQWADTPWTAGGMQVWYLDGD